MKCIQSLIKQGPLDTACPNVQAHGSKKRRLTPQQFTRRLCSQLSKDQENDFEPLHIRGQTGFLLKATLASHGYTVVIKATTGDLLCQLQREIKVYHLLSPLQGSQIPVCVGNFAPQVP
jgi:hypothetical protein